MTPAKGTVIANRFRLVRELGRGAMGEVWLADHLTLGVPCAVKLIVDQEPATPGARARFHAEAHAVARVQSPHVVRIYDHDVCDDVPYIAMELLKGEELRTRLQRLGRLTPLQTCRIVSQVARGLTKAHAAGIVHRDLKPENVFLAEEDDIEVAKLLDFGIAKLAAYPMLDAHVQVGAIIGSPNYMSPEQASGAREIDHRSDVWSLGVITFECLTGRRPFEGDSLIDLLAEVMAGEIPVPSAVSPGLPAAFDAWWQRAAARDPDRRFQSAGELADALAAVLGIDEPSAMRFDPAPLDATPIVFALERRAMQTPRTLVMPHDESTLSDARSPRARRGRFPALGPALTIAIVAGTLLSARADQAVRQVAAHRSHAQAVVLVATHDVPAARVEVPAGPPGRSAAGHSATGHVASPAARPAPQVARRGVRVAPYAPVQTPREAVEEVDFGI